MPENRLLRSLFRQFPTSSFAAIFLVLALFGTGWAQRTSGSPSTPSSAQSPNLAATPAQPSAPQTPPQSPNPPGAAQVPDGGATVQEQQHVSAQAPSAGQPEAQTRITKPQAKELFRSVDQILQFASHDTGLPVKHKVKRNLITRESVERYVDKRMKDDKDAQRLEQSRLVLEKFGLLPHNYDLHGEFLRLLGEQVAAYYDPKSKSVNLLDWVQPEIQKPVLAHELTHALQDQKINLEKWELAGGKEDGSPEPDQQEQVVEEAQAARQCVTEGQAMVVLLDYTLAPSGKNILSAPEIVDAMRASMADNKDSPLFAAAPMFLRESLLMPYTFGLEFVRAILGAEGRDAAYSGMLENPPIDTRQIMQPQTYLAKQDVAALVIPDLDKLVAPDYERFDFGGMGEFDVYLLAKQYEGDPAPRNYYPHWRGGYYFAAHAKAAPKDQIAMLYFSRWDSPEAARTFARMYADYLPKRYKKAVQEPASGNGSDSTGDPFSISFDTDQGKATLQIQGNDLLIMEGFDETVADRAREGLLQGVPSIPSGEPPMSTGNRGNALRVFDSRNRPTARWAQRMIGVALASINLIVVSVPLTAQQLDAEHWGRNTPGVELIAHEGPRQRTSAGVTLMYNLLGKGFPSGVIYALWQWPAGKSPKQMMQGVSFDKRGVLVCSGKPGYCSGSGPDDPINIQTTALPGEMKRMAVVSSDGKIVGFADAVPLPVNPGAKK